MSRLDSGEYSNGSSVSTSGDLEQRFRIEDINATEDTTCIEDSEPSNEFEKVIIETLKPKAANERVFNRFKKKPNKNQIIECIMYLIEWIKSEAKRVDEMEGQNDKKRTDIFTDSNHKYENLLSRIEQIQKEVEINESKMEQNSITSEDKLRKQIESQISNNSRTIEEMKNTFLSAVNEANNRVLSLESCYKSFIDDMTDKLSKNESSLKSEYDLIMTAFQENINKLEESLKSVKRELFEMNGSVEQQFSANKEFVESLVEDLKSCSDEMSELRTNCQKNAIQLKMDVKKCFKENVENGEQLREYFGKELKETIDSMESKLNPISSKANEALGMAKTCELELQELRAIPSKVEYLEANSIKLNELINNLKSGQKELNIVVVALAESNKQIKQTLQVVEQLQKETENKLKSLSLKQEVVENQIDSLSKVFNTSIEEINKSQKEMNEWIKNSDKRFDKLKKYSDKFVSTEKLINDSLMTFKRTTTEVKSFCETNKTTNKTLELETNNLKHVISKLEIEVRNQSKSISELNSDLKDNTRETNRVANVSTLLQSVQQDIRTRATAMEVGRGSSEPAKNEESLLSKVATMGLTMGLGPIAGPVAGQIASNFLNK